MLTLTLTLTLTLILNLTLTLTLAKMLSGEKMRLRHLAVVFKSVCGSSLCLRLKFKTIRYIIIATGVNQKPFNNAESLY